MRHRRKGRQFGRNSSHRRAMFRNLVTSLLEHGAIETTEAKAKEIKGIADKMITLGKKGDLDAKRVAFAYIQSRDVVARLFDTLAPLAADRNGGYTRVIKTRIRLGDSAPMAVIELVDKPAKVVAAPATTEEAAAKPVKKAPKKEAASEGAEAKPKRAPRVKTEGPAQKAPKAAAKSAAAPKRPTRAKKGE
jgi:large subunit ribosomal protein L17